MTGSACFFFCFFLQWVVRTLLLPCTITNIEWIFIPCEQISRRTNTLLAGG